MTAIEKPALGYPGKVDFIDVSSCQNVPGLDFAKVKTSGFEAVCVKGSTGAGSVDPACGKLMRAARTAGLLTFIYMFYIPNVDIKKQFQSSLDAEGDVHALRRVIDVEVFSKQLTTGQYVDEVKRLVGLCEENDGRPPCIYTAPYMDVYLAAALHAAEDLARCELWTAQYASLDYAWVPPPNYKPKVYPPWADWTMHQYSGNGGFRVPGVPGVDCDRNLYNGDLETFKREFLGLPDGT